MLVSQFVDAADVVHLANGEWPPYHSKNLEHYGIASRIITEAFRNEGIKVEYVFVPWKRGMQMAIDGKLDGTGVWRYKAKFAKDFYYSDPIIESQTVFFHLKSFKFDWQKFSDLKSLHIGGTIGYGYNDDYSNAEKSQEFNISRAKSDETNFRMLLAGHIDIFPITTEVGYFILKQKFKPEERKLVTHHPKSLIAENERSLHLLLSKTNSANAKLMEVFNRGLKKLKRDHKIKQYIDDFYASDKP
ncbi:hypothetical protein BTA51_14605 [Hahella sp. CCB-MM4]|nr:hypothetical protein BTA51_14605 [Hahella sp. CCB-MM4]